MMLERIKFSTYIYITIGFILGFFANLWILRSGFLHSLIISAEPTTATLVVSYVEQDATHQPPPQVTVTVYKEVPPPPTPTPLEQHSLEPLDTEKQTNMSEMYCRRNYKYLVLSIQRSGTHYLTATLKLNPYFVMGQELFKANYARDFQRQYNVSGERFEELSRKDLTSMISELIYGFGSEFNRKSEFKPFSRFHLRDGFILHHNQAVATPKLLPLLGGSKNWRAIHLVRENAFQVYVSLVLLDLTSEAHCFPGRVCKAHQATLKLDIEHTIRGMAYHEAKLAENRQMLEVNKIPYIEITYEGLLNGTESFCDIWKFCECSCAPLRPTGAVKSVNRKYSEIVENFAAVKKAIMKTKYAKYVRDLE